MSARVKNLRLSPELTQMLALARVRTGASGRAEVETEALGAVEADLDAPVPTPVLAYYAALGRALPELVRLTEAARQAGLDARYLAFAEHGGGFWCAPAEPERGECMVGHWSPLDESPPLEDSTMSRFVRRAHGLDAGPTEGERERVLAELKAFRVTLRPARRQSTRVVVHPKFGEGVVLREIRDGNHKLVIEFGSGVRTILARFVSDAVAARVA